MPPRFMALLFGALGAIAAWSIHHDLTTGVARNHIWRFNTDTDPGGCALLIIGKAFVVVYALAVIPIHFNGERGFKSVRPNSQP